MSNPADTRRRRRPAGGDDLVARILGRPGADVRHGAFYDVHVARWQTRDQVTPKILGRRRATRHRQSGLGAKQEAYEPPRRGAEDLPIEPDVTAWLDHLLTGIKPEPR